MKIFIAILTLAAATLAFAESSLSELANRQMDGVSSVKLRLVQEKYISILEDRITSFVILAADYRGNIRWQTTSPYESVSILKDSQFCVFEKIDGKWVEVHSPSDSKTKNAFKTVAAVVMCDFLKPVKGFEKTETDDSIILVPKSETLAKFLSKIAIKLDKKLGTILSISVENPDGDKTVIFVKTMVKNPSDISSAFDFADLDAFAKGK